MTSYIVRIYRRDAGSAEIIGTVEIPALELRLAFHSFGELNAILGRHAPDPAQGGDAGWPDASGERA